MEGNILIHIVSSAEINRMIPEEAEPRGGMFGSGNEKGRIPWN